MQRNHDDPNWVAALGVDDVKLEPYFVTAMQKGRISEVLEAVEGFELSEIEKLMLAFRIGQYVTEALASLPPETLEAMEPKE